MTTQGGYTRGTIEFRAARRGRAFDEQLALDTRSGAERARQKAKRGWIAPPEPKAKVAASVPAGKSKSKKR